MLDPGLQPIYAVEPRYPARTTLNENDARTAFEAGKRVVAAVRHQMPR